MILKFRGGPVGLDTIATSVAEEPETIEDVHEPFLIQRGLLARNSRGRVATELAYRHRGTPPQDQGALQRARSRYCSVVAVDRDREPSPASPLNS